MRIIERLTAAAVLSTAMAVSAADTPKNCTLERMPERLSSDSILCSFESAWTERFRCGQLRRGGGSCQTLCFAIQPQSRAASLCTRAARTCRTARRQHGTGGTQLYDGNRTHRQFLRPARSETGCTARRPGPSAARCGTHVRSGSGARTRRAHYPSRRGAVQPVAELNHRRTGAGIHRRDSLRQGTRRPIVQTRGPHSRLWNRRRTYCRQFTAAGRPVYGSGF